MKTKKSSKINKDKRKVHALSINNSNAFYLTDKSVKKQTPSFKERDLIDINVLRRIKEGDAEAFRKIMDKYYNHIYLRVLRSVQFNQEEAKDVIQDIYVKIFTNISKYNKQFTFNSWLTKVVDNHLIDYHRGCKQIAGYHNLGTSLSSMVQDKDGHEGTLASNITLLPVKNINTVIANGENIIEKRENKKMVAHLLDKMEGDKKLHKYQQFLRMFYMDEKSYDEIAKELELPLGTVKGMKFRAVRIFKDLVLAYEPNYKYA